MEIVERLMGESRERARMLEELIKAQMEVLRELVKKSRYKDRH